MSLVGTRPPTVDEWDKYDLHHRARLATKPGMAYLQSICLSCRRTIPYEMVISGSHTIKPSTFTTDQSF